MSLVATVYANDDLRDAVFWTVEDLWTGPNGQEVVLTKTGNSYAGVDIANALKDYPLSSSPGFRVRDISYSANNFVAIGASKKGSATVEDYLAMRNHYTEVDYPEDCPLLLECGLHSCTDYGELYPPELQTIAVLMADAASNVWETTTDANGNTRLTTLDGASVTYWEQALALIVRRLQIEIAITSFARTTLMLAALTHQEQRSI